MLSNTDVLGHVCSVLNIRVSEVFFGFLGLNIRVSVMFFLIVISKKELLVGRLHFDLRLLLPWLLTYCAQTAG